VNYDPETGVFTAKQSRARTKVGKVLGTLRTDGYVQLMIDGKWHKAHRLAWFYVYGEWPKDHEGEAFRLQLDHINRDPKDNRIGNLREADYSQQNMNKAVGKRNKSGTKGVFKDHNVWVF